MNLDDLTATQHTILALIGERIESEGVPPSQTEIAAAMGFSSVRAAQYHLEALEQAGAISRTPGRARGIRLCDTGLGDAGPGDLSAVMPAGVLPDNALRLPVLGRVDELEQTARIVGGDQLTDEAAFDVGRRHDEGPLARLVDGDGAARALERDDGVRRVTHKGGEVVLGEGRDRRHHRRPLPRSAVRLHRIEDAPVQ
ncbi:MAG: hypothetical protein KY442_13800 [Proteobacteria bacterium]|nr:hypothetical protein [Pseudomonadota bacterium]